MQTKSIKAFLDEAVDRYNRPAFIAADPISIPHLFTDRADIEVAGLFAALFAWGQRPTILAKSRALMERMDMAPAAYVAHASAAELARLQGFAHRTFNGDDARFFVLRLRALYARYSSMEGALGAFAGMQNTSAPHASARVEAALNGLHAYIFSGLPGSAGQPLGRHIRHLGSPLRGSACKRICMYLRWMVRSDGYGVDFGLWKAFAPAELICPVDVHVGNVSRYLGLLHRPQTDWRAALELTEALRRLDPADPVRYDFALFSIGAEK